jgi:TPR repeat protein
MKALAAAFVTLGATAFLADKLKLDEKVGSQGGDSQNIALDSSRLAKAQQRAEEAEAEIKRLRSVAEAAQKEAERLKEKTSSDSASDPSALAAGAFESIAKRGTISDPDGFTNLRLEPGTNDDMGHDVPVVRRILHGEVFEYAPNGSDWWPVRTSDGKQGFVHKSRIVAAEDNSAAGEQLSTTRGADLQQEAGSYMQQAEKFEKTGEWIQITSSPSFGTEVMDFDEAKRKADGGDAYAQAVVSIYYSTGYKTAKDTRQGLSYALQSAEQGHPLGAYRLGVILQEGEGGIPADPVEGVRLKARAVEGLNNMSGDPYAMTALGILLFRGEVLKKDQQLAAQLYQRAADMGYAPAQYTYSACLLFGRGITKDQDLGMRYWRAAYDQGYSYALQGPPK